MLESLSKKFGFVLYYINQVIVHDTGYQNCSVTPLVTVALWVLGINAENTEDQITEF